VEEKMTTLLIMFANLVICLFFVATVYAQAEGWRVNLALAVFNAFMVGVLLVTFLWERR
jgi:hypothetical protein